MESGVDEDANKRIYDSSVDYRGRIPLRDSTGGWKAAIFIIGVEISERLSYYGIASNLIMYLTVVLHQDIKTAAKNVNDWVGVTTVAQGVEISERLSYYGIASNLIMYLTVVLHQDIKTAAKNVNDWVGVTTVAPLVGGFLADAYVGRFWMVLISSIIYLMGLSLLTLSELIPSLKHKTCHTSSNVPCYKSNETHELVFFLALYLISLGTGGHKPSLESFGADQFDEEEDIERRKISFFNWWYFGVCFGGLLGVTVLVYIEDHVGWGAGFGALTAATGATIVILVIGVPYYRYRVPQGSPLTPILKVLVAATVKRNLPHLSDPSCLYETATNTNRLPLTDRMRFLDKAAIIDEEDGGVQTKYGNPQKLSGHRSWRLATVTQVEDTKQLLSIIPVWLSTLTFGLCVSQAQTFFVKQGSLTNRALTPSFTIPPASLLFFTAACMIVFVTVYDRLLVPALRRFTGNERGITVLQRIGAGMAFLIAGMISSALTEKKRRDHHSQQPISVFWLSPQFIILGISDVFTLAGLQEFFYGQVPDNMRSLGIALYLSMLGASSFLSSFLIGVVDSVTRKSSSGGRSWFGKDLNSSRLDYFYWLLASLAGVNLCVYVRVASNYSYKKVNGQDNRAENGEIAGGSSR